MRATLSSYRSAVDSAEECLSHGDGLGLNVEQRITLYDNGVIDRTLQFLDSGGDLNLTTLDERRVNFHDILQSLQKDREYVARIVEKGEIYAKSDYFKSALPELRKLWDRLAGEEIMIKSIIAPEVNR